MPLSLSLSRPLPRNKRTQSRSRSFALKAKKDGPIGNSNNVTARENVPPLPGPQLSPGGRGRSVKGVPSGIEQSCVACVVTGFGSG